MFVEGFDRIGDAEEWLVQRYLDAHKLLTANWAEVELVAVHLVEKRSLSCDEMFAMDELMALAGTAVTIS